MVGSCMGEISTGAQSVARTPMYALAGNCRFCPADPMKKAPTAVLNPLHHCWGPNWHKTTLKKDSMVPHVGTLADDLSCPVQPPSLVLCEYSLLCPGASTSSDSGRCHASYHVTTEFLTLTGVFVGCVFRPMPLYNVSSTTLDPSLAVSF